MASYTYDANGNRATRTVNGQTETYVNDAADKLTSISIGGNTVRSFTYDGRGRRKTDTYAGSTTTYSWDAESRLTSLARPGVTTSSFGYNGLDARVSKTDSTGTFSFKRNGAGVTDPVLSDGAATYTPGISERRAGSSKFLHSGMKNADAQSGASANVDSSRTYDAFGNLTGSVGTWSGPFGYAGGFGYQEDPDHGLRLLGHRYYDSSTGRFISKDPIGDGRNWTAYCEGNPVLAVDPSGLVIQWLLKRFLELGIDLLIELVFEEMESRLGRNGSTVHKELGDITKRAAKQLGLEDWVHVEQPYLRGKPTPNRIRPLGCVIPDVALGPKDKPFATIDWKTGKRGMTRRQREGVVTHVFTTRPGLIMEVGRKGLKKHIVYGRMHLPL